MTIQDLRLINKATISYLNKLNQSTKRNDLIAKILENDNVFLELNKDDSLIILKDIGVSLESLETIYLNLINA